MGCRFIGPAFILIWVHLNGFSVDCQRPKVVNVGAVLSYDSVIGRASKVAIEAAEADVNADPTILRGIKLNFIMEDTNCSVFMGSMEAFQLLEREVVAIIGPQSSSIAHMISFIATGLQVPLISFAATDPTLSSLQFPFFLRSTPSDSYQMAAISDLVDHYGWHDVIAVYVDDDYGRNGISSLDTELSKRDAKLAYRLPLPVGANSSQIADLLQKSKDFGPRVYVVHVNPDSGLAIFSTVKHLKMMTSGYVWLTTEWLSAALDSSSPINNTSLCNLQGVVGLRQHTHQSARKKAFFSRWRGFRRKGLVDSGLNAYALYAYDTVWTVAHAIDDFLEEYGSLTFSISNTIQNVKGAVLQIDKLKTFDGGKHLLRKLMLTNFTGLTGLVKFDSDRNLINSGYEVINVDGSALRRIGYWSTQSGLLDIPPEKLGKRKQSRFEHEQKLNEATWPGGMKETPRGWVIASNNKPLIIGVPKRVSFVDFVTEDRSTHEIRGYCIDVFNAARELVPYDIPYRFQPFGDGKSNPNYDQLVRMVAEDVFDAAVGDITIVTNRTTMADFTQPYAANGLVIVIPVRKTNSDAWVYLKPFTVEMWCVTGAFFVLIGIVIWILEHRINDDFRGSPRQQIITMFLFSFSTLFKTNQEATVSTLGRIVMMVWLFLLMVITSSYTASLTSILTVEQLSSPITGIDTLISSNQRIGYPKGSFVRSYLVDSLNVYQSRLVPLGNITEYVKALRLGPENGGVAAIVDELPYVEQFLSGQTDFGIVGQMFTRSGWGFAFKKGSPLAVHLSTAILRLSESGELQKLNEKWFCKTGCISKSGHRSEPNQLHLISFSGLFLLCGIVTVTALVAFLLRLVRQFVRYKKTQRQVLPASTSRTGLSRVIFSFFDFIDEKEEAVKNMFRHSDNHPQQPPANGRNVADT